MQLDPIKSMLKAPRTKRLKLTYNGLLSNVAFKFNLRRYNPVPIVQRVVEKPGVVLHGRGVQIDSIKYSVESSYAVRVGGSNGDLDLLELIDGGSYKLQCRSASEIREADFVLARVY